MDIKFVVFDFDGVFTDGKIYFPQTSNIMKAYNVKDGTGISLLQNHGIEVGVISGYKENISQKEILNHLNIIYTAFATKNKLAILQAWCNQISLNLDNVAYMGDDINDIEIMNHVALSGCPMDAHNNCIKISKFISTKKGGNGCVREFCDYIIDNLSDTPTNILNIINEIKTEFLYQTNNFKIEDITKIANIIKLHKHNIYCCGVGKSGNMSKHCCDLLKCISYPCFYLDVLNATHGDIGTLTPNDLILLFSNSGNTTELINIIPIFKTVSANLIGICCNEKSKFKELCDTTIVTPFNKEISGKINKIPTNSYMSHLLFVNILVSILKENITLEQYKKSHLAGNIGQSLLKIKDILITKYPTIIINDITNKITIQNILLEMTNHKIGCCFFINKDNKLLGLLTDGDIRRLLINYIHLEYITLDHINTSYYYETDTNKYIKDIQQSGYIPIIINNKLTSIINTNIT